MRWDELFADLDGQLEQELESEHAELAAEEERLRVARLSLRERLLAMSRGGGTVTIVVSHGEMVEMLIDSAGRDWVAGSSLRGTRSSTILVPLGAVASVVPGGNQLEESLRPVGPVTPGDLSSRLGLAFVLRELCRRRAAVEVCTRVGSHHGTIDRVARDHLDLAEHELGEPRSQRLVRRIRLIAFDAILSVRM